MKEQYKKILERMRSADNLERYWHLHEVENLSEIELAIKDVVENINSTFVNIDNSINRDEKQRYIQEAERCIRVLINYLDKDGWK